jgi:hypothetical protein
MAGKSKKPAKVKGVAVKAVPLPKPKPKPAPKPKPKPAPKPAPKLKPKSKPKSKPKPRIIDDLLSIDALIEDIERLGKLDKKLGKRVKKARAEVDLLRQKMLEAQARLDTIERERERVRLEMVKAEKENTKKKKKVDRRGKSEKYESDRVRAIVAKYGPYPVEIAQGFADLFAKIGPGGQVRIQPDGTVDGRLEVYTEGYFASSPPSTLSSFPTKQRKRSPSQFANVLTGMDLMEKVQDAIFSYIPPTSYRRKYTKSVTGVWTRIGWRFELDPDRKDKYEKYPNAEVTSYWQSIENRPGITGSVQTARDILENMTQDKFAHQAQWGVVWLHWDDSGRSPEKSYEKHYYDLWEDLDNADK